MTPVFLALAARWLAGWYVGGRCPTLALSGDDGLSTSPRKRTASASIIIPARNEAAVLPTLLQSLREQSLSAREVIVVDDHSTDDTATVARHAGATVLQSAALPPGWLGKPWACAQGAAAASGEVLVFLDADTRAGTHFLARLVDAVQRSGAVVSVAPYHRTEKPYELGSALFNLVAFMGVGATSLSRSPRVAGAFGPCIAIRSEHYAAIRGHHAVRNEVLEDVAFANVCQAHSIAVINVAGGSDLRYRMYPDGPAQLIEGWSKNFAAGAARTPALRLLAIVAWLSGIIEAGLMTAAGVAGMFFGGPGPSWEHALFYCLFAAQLHILLRRLGNFGPVGWLHPLATLAFLVIVMRSVVLQVRGEVTWKGRTIVLHSRPNTDG